MKIQQLIERCLGGDHTAWEKFAKLYGRLLEFSARKRLAQWGIRLDDLEAEEIVQQILVHIWEGKKLAQVKSEERITAWLAAVAGNLAIDCWRKQNQAVARRSVSLSENLAHGEGEELFLSATLVAEGISPREESEKNEQNQILHQAILQLSTREQLVIKASYFLNQTHEEIAQMLGLPRNTVSTLIDRAKKKLRQMLEEKSDKEVKEKTN